MLRGTATVVVGPSSWTTPLNGHSGTAFITLLTSTRIAGIFSFIAADILNPGSTKSVTNGSFDLPITGTPGTLPPNQGSRMAATLGGTVFTPATCVTVAKTGGVYSFGCSTVDGYSIQFTLSGVTGPMNIPLGAVQQMQVHNLSQAWSSALPGSSGSVAITSVDSNRLMGTFSATLGSGSSAPALVVTGGSFDIGLGP
jgi:hypothetical protein